MRKFFKYILPLSLIVFSIMVVVAMVAVAKGKRPERKDTGEQALVVNTIPARVESLNFSVVTQGSAWFGCLTGCVRGNQKGGRVSP